MAVQPPPKDNYMAPVDQTLQDRRSGTRQIIEHLTRERGQMLALFCQVAGLEPYESEGPVEKELLQEFCQVLVDYIAAGHFALYERILDGKERRKDVLELAEDLYGRIADTTDFAVDFNDKYDADDYDGPFDELDEDLARLGEELATRIELEDKLIAAL